MFAGCCDEQLRNDGVTINNANYMSPKEAQGHPPWGGPTFQAALCFKTLFFKSSKKKSLYSIICYTIQAQIFGMDVLKASLGARTGNSSGLHRKSESTQPDPCWQPCRGSSRRPWEAAKGQASQIFQEQNIQLGEASQQTLAMWQDKPQPT